MSQHLQSSDPHDPTAEARKKDHIGLAFASQTDVSRLNQRFNYEPMLSGHPKESNVESTFVGKRMRAPLWISSMTGGTAKANKINSNLARVCGEFGLGMGLGSCRSLLHSDDHLKDFKVRHLVGDQPLYANLGIAQLETMVDAGELGKIDDLVRKLEADGLIVHVNPLQEWLQPEGDRYYTAPIEIIKRVRDAYGGNIIVKEVGQGYGPQSMKALLAVGIQAMDFAANGGTNFSKIELSRAEEATQDMFDPLVFVGHSAEEMVGLFNSVYNQESIDVIISGGVKNFLDGYYLITKCQANAVYGQASGFLKHAMGEYQQLKDFVEGQINGLSVARSFLTIKE